MNRDKVSVVIPVFNSANLISATIDRVVAEFERQHWALELILVNDGSEDRSWEVISGRARRDDRVIAIDLVKNYGQHAAIMCGLLHSTGEFVVTIDDDLQNPPEEIAKLVDKAREGYELVLGEFKEKRHSLYRRIGSAIVSKLNEIIFGKPKSIRLSNFRLISRAVVERMRGYETANPYITGLVMMFSSSVTNVVVEHHDRAQGRSTYNLARLLRLVAVLLFNYSSWPLRFAALVGAGVAVFTFCLGGVYFFRGLFFGSSVPGWTSLVVLLSFFNGILMLMLSMLGEYTVRILNHVSRSRPFIIKEIVDQVGGDTVPTGAGNERGAILE